MHEIALALLNASISADTRARLPLAVAYVRESLMRQDPDGYARSCFALADAPAAAVEQIEAPVLLVTGDEDVVAPPQAVRSMAEKLHRARSVRVVVLPKCGHWTPVERPEECARELRRFLDAIAEGDDMADVLFTNVRVFDGGGEAPFMGDVLVQGNKISRVVKTAYGQRTPPIAGAQVIDGAGAFLMPGMVEAHTHFSWNNQPGLDAIQRMPPEEHILWCAEVAKRYLDMGWTSCVGAAAAKPRLDVVIRNAINDGTIIGPRYLAASQEITVPGGLGDTTQPHLPQPEFAFGAIVSGPHEMRRCVRMFAKYGVDTLKINLSGESITGMPSEASQFTEEEITVCVQEAKAWGKRVAAHARSTWSIKQCVKQGIEVIYHASFADEEALDLLEQHKFEHFVAPGLAWLINTCHNASHTA